MITKLEGIVNEEMVDKLIEAHNSCPPEEDLHVYLGTDGGSEDDMNAIINIINESDKIPVVFCFSRVYSAGFVIAMKCLKPVEFLDSCLGMFHAGTFYGGVWTDELKVHKSVKDSMKLHSKNARKLTEEMIGLGIFTKKEEAKLRKNKDVYFNTNRLRQMREIVWLPIQAEIDEYIEARQARMEAEQESIKDEVVTLELPPQKNKTKTLKKTETNLDKSE